MDSTTINKLLKNYSGYLGTFPRDMLPKIQQLPATLIVNTDPSTEPGEHWIAIHIDSNGNGEYFDSYGLPPLHKEIIVFLNKYCPLSYGYNPIILQCFDCTTCGRYCVLYCKYRCNSQSFCKFLVNFSTDTYKNNVIINSLVPIN